MAQGTFSIVGCKGRCCCPTVSLIDDNTIEIKDDYEGKVTIPIEQIDGVLNKITQLLKHKLMAQ